MTEPAPLTASDPKNILLLGATGTIGRATLKALMARGHTVTCLVRNSDINMIDGAAAQSCDLMDLVSIRDDGFRDDKFDAVVSCMASRTGAPKEAWAVDYQAHANVLTIAREHACPQFVLLSAICVQKPLLDFQLAKKKFEHELIRSGLTYSIVRPTAFFKSLSGQIDRVKAGKSFLIFGDGQLTACKPISDRDLAAYIVDCLTNPDQQNAVLPIGGPGPAITPREQGEYLFKMIGRPAKYKSISPDFLKAVATTIGAAGKVIPPLAAKAALARIGHYYATESMLVWDEANGCYDANATPETGSDTLFDHYARVLSGDSENERVETAVF